MTKLNTQLTAGLLSLAWLISPNQASAENLTVNLDTIDTIVSSAGVDLVGSSSTLLVMGAFKGKTLANLQTEFGGYTSAGQVFTAFSSDGGFSAFDTALWSEEGSDYLVSFAADHTTVLDNYTADAIATATYPIVMGVFNRSSLSEFAGAGALAEFAVVMWENGSFPRGGASGEAATTSLPFEFLAASNAYSLIAGDTSTAGALRLEAIPEPSSAALLALGLCVLSLRKKFSNYNS
jgi:hypothetical protein